MPISDVRSYLDGSFAAVQGWCIPQLWHAIEPLYNEMAQMGPVGPIAEIGVFQGKFFIGLVKTVGAGGNNYAIDVFDMQEFNLDKAGEGNVEALRTNLEKSGVDLGSIEFLKTDSMWLNRQDLAKIYGKTGGFSLFSIDGCHLPEHTINDMHAAFELTRPNGIIFVDDYYNANWPGVQEGVAKYYLNNTARFAPLLFTCNKLFLCNLSYHDKYLRAVHDHVAKHHPTTRIKKVKRFGFDTLTLTPDYSSTRYLSDA